MPIEPSLSTLYLTVTTLSVGSFLNVCMDGLRKEHLKDFFYGW